MNSPQTSQSVTYHDLLATAVLAARAGAEAIAAIRADGQGLQVRHKGRHDLVTRADTASERAILARIRQEYPDDAILGEEGVGNSDRASARNRIWIVDPIDGTTNFAHGVPFWAISIACWEGDQPVAAVVHAPDTGETFTATFGGGAFLNGNPIQVSSCASPSAALIGTGFPYRDLDLMEPYLDLFRRLMRETQGVRRPGSASYDLAYVAAGRYDGFYEYGLAPWDVAAGGLLVAEAGGVVTDWTGGDHWLHGARIVAGPYEIHEFLLRAIVDTFHPDSLRIPSP